MDGGREGRRHRHSANDRRPRRRRPLSGPNYRSRSGNYRRLRSSASSAFFIMTHVK